MKVLVQLKRNSEGLQLYFKIKILYVYFVHLLHENWHISAITMDRYMFHLPILLMMLVCFNNILNKNSGHYKSLKSFPLTILIQDNN